MLKMPDLGRAAKTSLERCPGGFFSDPISCDLPGLTRTSPHMRFSASIFSPGLQVILMLKVAGKCQTFSGTGG
jgi:hypothetical protein